MRTERSSGLGDSVLGWTLDKTTDRSDKLITSVDYFAEASFPIGMVRSIVIVGP